MTVNTPRRNPSRTGAVSRRRLLTGLVVTPLLAAAVAACGDPDTEPAATDPTTGPTATDPTATDPTATSTPGAAITYPTDATTAVVRYAYEGGFVPVEVAFTQLPNLVVSGDGRVYRPAATTAIYPGPLVQPFTVRTITDEGVQTLLALADEHGLLAPPPDYSAELNIADAPDTVVRLQAADGSYEHRAYALGIAAADDDPESELTEPRRQLARFVQALVALEDTVGAAALGEETIVEPEAYRLRATPVDESTLGGLEVEPTFVDWPAAAGLDLATASSCATVTATQVGDTFADATQTTYFRQDGATYQLAVAIVLPGDAGCDS
ncbi:MAG: hypothetical protein R2713_16870 [Ilumatobacteraceae bacterium]|nr:hypothetical protein [Acidimicrobiales bacterium]MCB9393690.1 hypothetical protein [Acidimicrobiaceae bacterium]